MIASPVRDKEDNTSKNNKAEKRLLDSSKVKDLPQMNSSSDLERDRDGFSHAVAEAREKMGGKNTKGSGSIFGCFFCCGPKNSSSATTNRRRPIPKPEKRKDLLTSPTTTDLEEE